jgi:DNA topoisomerase-1
MDKIDAQQARRVLDRIMGYKLSPLLWSKIAKGLSAGRVQSVAVRLIVEREREIKAFQSEEYWRVTAHFTEDGKPFEAELRRLGETRIEKNLQRAQAEELVQRVARARPRSSSSRTSPRRAGRRRPFTTSQLQQKASTLLRFSAEEDDDDRAAALRGRGARRRGLGGSDHVHAHRLDAREPGGAHRGARAHRP